MPKLVVKTGQKKGLVYRLAERNVSIGRDPLNTLVLLDDRVSMRHAQIVFKRKKYIIIDLGSTNGIMVNDVLVTKHILKPGDKIKLGGTVLDFLSLSTKLETEEKTPGVKIITEKKCL